MIVVLTSLSEKQASHRIETVCDSYLTRISTTAWIGVISEEGLEDIRKAIVKHASRNTAISCFKIRGHDRFECFWQIGNNKRTTENGVSCVSRRKKQVVRDDFVDYDA